MTQELAVALKNVAKVYKRYQRPVDRLKELLLPQHVAAESFWALRDISLEIAPGDTVGIIGRNGSGKSTLLQIIANTLQPTAGEVAVNGRVSALLELGSGFNPEFTGRQNAFFNGRILGLSKAEIASKFDAIAAFADIGSFIDQPVKTYSSGMFVRLAFAVAISAEPDILIVDEALSVGDEAFQRKCFARIYEMQEKGTTVLFVSHSATSIVELCDHAVLMDAGEIVLKGTPKAVVANYQKLIYAPKDKRAEIRQALMQSGAMPGAIAAVANPGAVAASGGNGQRDQTETLITTYDPYLVPQHVVAYQSRGAKIKHPAIKTLADQNANLLIRNETYRYCYRVHFHQAAFNVRFGMMLKTISGFELGGGASHPSQKRIDFVPPGTGVDVEFQFCCALLPGTYFLNAGVMGFVDGEDVYLDRAVDAVMFKVQPELGVRATGTVDFQVTAKITTASLTA